jgi:hypothetical protein
MIDTSKNDQSDGKMKLINLSCWNKISFYFGSMGPEILFFCHQDPISKIMMPDLEPIKVMMRQFDENVIEL